MYQETGNVVTCAVDDCSYNAQKLCTAPDIRVAEDHPACETYTTSGTSGEMFQENDGSHVGGCASTDCTFNQEKQCEAPGITVTHHADHADCGSYRH